LGIPNTFYVSSIQDITPPELTSFSFSPDSVDVSAGPDTLDFTASATDDLSGLTYGGVEFRSPTGSHSIYGSISFEQGSLSDTTTGIIIVDQYSEAGPL